MSRVLVSGASLVVVVAGCFGALRGEDLGRRGAARAGKMLAATGCMALAAVSGAADTVPGRWFLVGLALSWVGDLALTFEARGLLVGMAAFAAAHLAYAAGFVRAGTQGTLAVVGVVAAAALATAVWRRLGPHLDGRWRRPVAGYIFVISLMLGTATAGVAARPLASLGAWLFAISDLFVARERFVISDRRNRWRGLPLYFAAQCCIALGA